MKSKTFVMMFVAIGCGLVAAYLTARLTAKGTSQNTVPVLVAKEKIKAGDVIKDPEKLFIEMNYPAGSTPNAISSFESLKNKIVNKGLQPGQWLTPDDLSTNFGIDLPKGFYAMAVKVDASSAAGGFILPRSRVNVVATIRNRTNTGETAKVVTVLQDVLVLAVDQQSIRPEDKLAVNTLSTATLAVKPSESQRLTLAQGLGELRLVLRAHDDDSKVPLTPLDKLEYDNGTGESFIGDKEIYKVAIAKQDMAVGQEVDVPEDFFDIKELPFLPEKAITLDSLGELKGKVVKHPIFKDGFVTAKNFDALAVVKAVPRARTHVLFIQNGGSAPVKHVFKDGISDVPEAKGTTPTSTPPTKDNNRTKTTETETSSTGENP
ncbi:MAG TPA: Flp pilus assembly protein CpaB [Gemmataceae bacterium]|jgi:Flp pilus assembly protein CpaB|nr:Flp pilus assembly protein CpaB [Gemmataceae bacterium]